MRVSNFTRVVAFAAAFIFALLLARVFGSAEASGSGGAGIVRFRAVPAPFDVSFMRDPVKRASSR